MAIKKFLTSVADVRGYDSNDNLLFTGKTLLNSSISSTLSNTDVRAGRGNQLLYSYWHTQALEITISDAQWNLEYLSTALGTSVTTGANVWVEESITLDASKGGSVTGTPLTVAGTTVYGWVTHEDGDTERVEFSTKAFTTADGAEGDVVCVRYYANNASARQLVVPANAIPAIVRLSMEAQLASSDVSTNIVGAVQIEIPRAQMTGGFEISLAADGVSSTPLNCRALSYTETSGGCASAPQYAKITEIITGADWRSELVGISIAGGDFALATTTGTRQLVVWAVPRTGAPYQVSPSLLTWATSAAGTATVVGGLVTGVAAGTAQIKASVTGYLQYDATVVVTVP